MKITEVISHDSTTLLLEGGMALKGVQPVTQSEARRLIPKVIKRVAKALSLPETKVKAIGSAGKRPKASDTSGDIDVAVETSADRIVKILPGLSDNHRVMKAINVYSYAEEIAGKQVQIDLIPVENIKHADWAYQAHEEDLKGGLKGSHRNELFFAVCSVLKKPTKRADGDVVEQVRYMYSLHNGLSVVKQTREGGKKGKVTKNFKTVDRTKISTDPDVIAKKLFGSTGKQCSTFKGTLDAINSPSFPYKSLRDKIIEQAKRGMMKKNLSIPKELGGEAADAKTT